MEKGSGMSTRTLSSLNAVGGAAFSDNPRTGEERANFFEYLNIPAFETKNVPPRVRVQMRDLDEFSDSESFVSLAMVRGIKTGEGWARIEIVDETGSAGVFTNEHNQIETGQMYILLISNNRVARYMKVDEFDENADDPFTQFLMSKDLSDMDERHKRVVAFIPRTTKANKRMAEVVMANHDKSMEHLLVFPANFMMAYGKMPEGAEVQVTVKETQEGTLFLDKV